MNIIICIKQVPDLACIKLNSEAHTLKRENIATIINPFDFFAIEAALRFKEQIPDTTIRALSMGPLRAAEVIKEAISYGIDEGLLLSDSLFAGSDTWATTLILAAGIKYLGGADFIICGKQAIDGETAQVGPSLAYRLGIPHVSFVKAFTEISSNYIIVLRQMDDGYDVVRLPFPSLITVMRTVGTIRPPSLKAKIRAKNYKVPIATAVNLGLAESKIGSKGSYTKVEKIFIPHFTANKREVILGPATKASRIIINKLVAAKLIIV